MRRLRGGWITALGCVLLLAGLSSGTLLRAQVYAGSLTGQVLDPSGDVIPGATVTVTNVANGFVFRGKTNSKGLYSIRALPPATYIATASANGFRKTTQPNIQITVNQAASLTFHLEVGSSTQTVTVTAAPPLLDTENAETGQHISNTQIQNLPLVNRNVMSLVGLTPGIVPNQGGDDFYSDGGRNGTSDVLLDGVTTENYDQNAGIRDMSYSPSVDSIQEFSVQQTNFSAEFGNTGGTVVNMITKSGTNQFHGSLYDFDRNQHIDANGFFSNASNTPISPLSRNEFGGTLGGPILHNKMFFFVDYDGTRETSMVSGAQWGVPDQAERTGDFGDLCTDPEGATGTNGTGNGPGHFNSAGLCVDANNSPLQAGQIWDPYTGYIGPDPEGGSSPDTGTIRSAYIPFDNMATYISPGNPLLASVHPLPATPGNLIDPVALKLMQGFPLPNYNIGTQADPGSNPNYNPYNNFIASGSTPSRNDQFDIKIDRNFTHDLLSVKYSESINSSKSFNAFGNEFDSNSSGTDYGKGFLFSLNETHTFTPNLLLIFTYGFNRTSDHMYGISGEYPGFDPTKLIGEPSYMDAAFPPALPAIDANDYNSNSGYMIGTQPWSYVRGGNDTNAATVALSWIHGTHSTKLGFDTTVNQVNFFNPGPTGGEWGFGPGGTNEGPDDIGGDDLASLLTGAATEGYGTYEIGNAPATTSQTYGFYVQDNWKLASNFTLNLGLRWDVDLPRTERYNHQNYLDASAVNPISSQLNGFGPVYGEEVFASPSQRYNWGTDWNEWQPRIGFSWQALPQTVVRGGYGIYYQPCKCGAAGPGTQGWQGYVEDTNVETTYNFDGATPYGFLSDPFPNGGPQLPPGNSLGALNDVGQTAQGNLLAWTHVPYVQTWSFGIQRQLPGQMVLSATYSGSKGTHLYYGGAGFLNFLPKSFDHYAQNPTSTATKQEVNGVYKPDPNNPNQQVLVTPGLTSYVANPFYGVITNPNSDLSGQTVQQFQLDLPFPEYDNFGQDGAPWGISSYNALKLKLQKHMSNDLDLLISYTFSKSLDDTSNNDYNSSWLGLGSAVDHLQDPNCLRCEYSVSEFDLPQVFQFTYIYQLPIGRGHLIGSDWSGWTNALLGGWQTSGTWQFNDGFPLGVTQGGQIPTQSFPTYGETRPELLARPERSSNWKSTLTNYFANASEAFGATPLYGLGSAPRTLPWLRAPGEANAEMAAFKTFDTSFLREGTSLQFRVEAFNALNHVQFGAPDTSYGSGDFGDIFGTANSPRQVQLGLTFTF